MSFYYSFKILSIIFLRLFKGFNKRKENINLIYILIKARIILHFNNMFLIRVLNKNK